MPRMRTFAMVVLALFGGRVFAQQEPPAVASPWGPVRIVHEKAGITAETRWVLWVRYPDFAHAYLDHATYLADLQSRFGDRGVRIVVVGAGAAAAAAKSPGHSIAELAQDEAEVPPFAVWSALAPAQTPAEPVAWNELDGAVDRIEAALSDRGDANIAGSEELLASLLQSLGDGGDYGAGVEQVVAALPKSGRAHAAAVLFQWWCKGDYQAARAAVDAALKALAGEAVPLCVFADMALRGDRTDPTIAKALAMALAPVAAGAPDGLFTQLVYLRALVRAGQDRLAGRIAATLPKRLAGKPWEQLVFAEALMEAADPKPFRDIAELQIREAESGGADRRFVYGAKHKVLVRCGVAPERCDELAREYRGSDVFSSSLNNDAWYMVTLQPTMGRFDTLALAQAQEMQRQEGDRMDHGNRDTVALVLFLNGQVEAAVELQTAAARGSNNDPEYVGRLTRFENALAAQRAAKAAPK